MGYEALLFCADEKLARVVSQVFTELEFNIEPVNEPFSAVKKLMAQHYDAIVVDCENEQNASLIFKSARNSTGNQNSLALALVEGQAGVAKAYRIGANLVLTKPINVEQAKGTLRVARGLLRKNADATASKIQPAPVTTPAASAPLVSSAKPESAFAAPDAREAKAAFELKSEQASENLSEARFNRAAVVPEVTSGLPGMAASTKTDDAAPAVPEVRIESPVLKEPSTKGEIAAPPIPKSLPTPPIQDRTPAVTFGSLQGAAAAPAPAKEITAPVKKKATEKELFEPSFAKARPTEVVAAPTFSALGEGTSEGSGSIKKFLTIAAVALVAMALGYFGYTKFGRKDASPQSSNAVQNLQPAQSPAPGVTFAPSTAANGVTAPTGSQATAVPVTPQGNKPQAGTSSPVTKIATEPEETKPDVVTRNFEPAPIHVRTQSAGARVQPQADEGAPAVPDPLGVGAGRDSNLASLVSGPAKLPAAPLSTLRISQGVSQGLLIKKVQPVYPQNAKAMRLEGPVDMEAVIDKEGKITNLKVLKGQPVLARAAADAVRQWRYKPYYLDGDPVEIETQITIVFKLPK